MSATDTATYPDDRNTRQTAAQRARKVESARVHVRSALRDLEAVCDDFAANAYRLTEDERAEWRVAATMHGDLTRALPR